MTHCRPPDGSVYQRGEAGLQRSFLFVAWYGRVVEVVVDEAAAHLRGLHELPARKAWCRASDPCCPRDSCPSSVLVSAVEDEISVVLEHEHVDGAIPPVALRPELRLEEVVRDARHLAASRICMASCAPSTNARSVGLLRLSSTCLGRHVRIVAGIDAGADDVAHFVHGQQLCGVAHLRGAHRFVTRDIRVVEPVGDEAAARPRGLNEIPREVRAVQVLFCPRKLPLRSSGLR